MLPDENDDKEFEYLTDNVDYTAPELKNGVPSGLKSDCWSFGILIGVILGLEQVCPPNFYGGPTNFIKNCAFGRHDIELH